MRVCIVTAFLGLAVISGSLVALGQTKAAIGEELFTSKGCHKCHSVAGKGAKLSKLDGVATKVSAADLRKWLTAPGDMEAKLSKKPAVKMSSKVKDLKLTDPEIDALVAYLQTLK